MVEENDRISSLITLNEELENYFANTIVTQLYVDAELVLCKFTPLAMKKFQLKPGFIGSQLKLIFATFKFPEIIENIKTVISTGQMLEKEIQTTDLHWYRVNILPYLIRKEKRIAGVIITYVDFTPQNSELKEQEHLITEHKLLLSNIAHDIKNPVLGLTLALQMLKRLPDKNSPQHEMLLTNGEQALERLKTVITDLIDSRWKKYSG
ncbi:PAS domain-containing protein [Pedobacter sp. MC2016-15]|uniref:PAS domain-containing protein n=1 Tax=Pedobacter sp. MC2016-15 TaxID=2994473 RepID=UPI002246A51D|nr:PAS domain-containing protein [Pedobacter sp. MC2016-15]MCX2481573.1 PAS domain-containing protein [Pedobacter sp. MC2016-15]